MRSVQLLSNITKFHLKSICFFLLRQVHIFIIPNNLLQLFHMRVYQLCHHSFCTRQFSPLFKCPSNLSFLFCLHRMLYNLMTVCNQAGKGGELTHDETTIIAGALELTEKTAGDAMTPISETFAIDINAKLDRCDIYGKSKRKFILYQLCYIHIDLMLKILVIIQGFDEPNIGERAQQSAGLFRAIYKHNWSCIGIYL